MGAENLGLERNSGPQLADVGHGSEGRAIIRLGQQGIRRLLRFLLRCGGFHRRDFPLEFLLHFRAQTGLDLAADVLLIGGKRSRRRGENFLKPALHLTRITRGDPRHHDDGEIKHIALAEPRDQGNAALAGMTCPSHEASLARFPAFINHWMESDQLGGDGIHQGPPLP